MSLTSSPPTCVVLTLPFQQHTVHYRAYAELVEDQSVFDWALARIAAACPALPLVCVCAGEQEQRRAAAASRLTERFSFMTPTGQHEVLQVRQLMDMHHVSRVVACRLSHALVPIATLIQKTLLLHHMAGAALTDVSGTAFATPLYVVDASAIDSLVAIASAPAAASLISAAAAFQSMHVGLVGMPAPWRWSRLNMANLLRIPLTRWPEAIALETAYDVALLRSVVDSPATTPLNEQHYVDAWKHHSTMARRIAPASPVVAQVKGTTRSARTRTRVLYVSTSSYFHGAAQSLCDLVEHLDLGSYEPFVVIPFAGVLTDELTRLGTTVICPNRDFHTRDGWSVAFAHRVIREVSPEVVHGNFHVGAPLIAAITAAGIPLVQHVRVASVRKFSLEVHSASAIIAVSQLVKRRLGELDVELDRVDVILDGVNTKIFSPALARQGPLREQLELPRDEFIVASIGRMHRQKRHEAMIEAVRALRSRTGRGHVLLVAAFDGDDKYHSEIRDLAQRKDMKGHVTHVEFTRDIATMLRASDCLALMSENEALGRVALEGMAVGLPVIVSDSSGVTEVICHGSNGFIVPYKSSDALAEVLTMLSTNGALTRSVGMAAAETVEQTLSAVECARQTTAVYDRVLATRAANEPAASRF